MTCSPLTHPRVRIVAVVALVVLTAVAVRPQAAHAVTRAPAYDVFTGSVADFYIVPSPLPPGAPGDLIRVQAVSSDATSTTLRIMYHSIDGAGRDRAVTGTLTYPNATPPPGGWPVISIANGTVGLGPQCALSRNGTPVFDVGTGGVAVDSDYIGEGPVGEVQAYLSRASEAHSVLDAVRAARNVAAAHAGDRFVVLGGSQGGHGALSANELAQSYAPELDLLGTVALAPAAMFDRTYGTLDEYVTLVVTAMGFIGQATEHPEINLADYASPAGLTALQTIRSQCTSDIISTVLGVPAPFFTHDPRVTEPARSIMLANDVGNVAAPSPVLLIQGTADTTVDPRRTDDLFARMCGVGQVTEYVKVPGADHGTVGAMSLDETEAWLRDRLAGKPAPDSCTKVGSSTTTTTTSAPPTTTQPDHAAKPTTTLGSVTPVAAHQPSAPTPSAHSAGELPATGAPVLPFTVMGFACIAVGVVLLGAKRRCRV